MGTCKSHRVLMVSTILSLSQGGRSRGGGAGGLAPPPQFFRKNKDLLREESLQPPQLKSQVSPPPQLEKCSAVPVSSGHTRNRLHLSFPSFTCTLIAEVSIVYG